MTVVSAEQGAAGEAGYPPRRAVTAWLFFDWSAQPFFTLVATFVYAPFFASALAADPASGQALWGYATGIGGLTIALLSPWLGGVADRYGPRKPFIAGFGAMLVAGSALLWFAVPGAGTAVPIALCGYVLAMVGAEFATTFNNAMMTRLVPPERLGRLSGTGWAVGYCGGLIALALTLGLIAASPQTGLTLAGLKPILGLDPATREGDRFSGLLTAAWFVIFVTPMFLLTPDAPRTGHSLREAASGGFGRLRATLADLPSMPGLGRFLLANMIYQDGLVALFAFGGIYGAGVFGWQTIELGLFGILLTVTGTLGAWLGGRIDDAIGGKRVVLGSIVALSLACLGILSLGPDRILFVVEAAPATPGDGLFASLPERVYLAFGVLIGLVAGPLQASSRSLLARLAPSHRIGEFFGLFALSGKVTSFVGPTLVALATTLFASQRAGLAVLLLIFATGGLLLAGVRSPRR